MGFDRGYTNTQDLRTHLYKTVQFSGENAVTLVTSITQTCAGIIQTRVASSENVTVRTMGQTRMFAGGTITAGDKLTLTLSATFATATSGDVCYGQSEETVASGSYFQGMFYGGLAAETITQG